MKRACRLVLAALGAAIAMTVPPVALGQGVAWPVKPVKFIVPFPPGGSVDPLARLLGVRLADSLGQPFIIENKTGASGAIGTAFVAKSPPDGYTYVVVFDTHAVNPALNPDLQFDTLKDLAPVATLVNTQMLLVVSPAVPAKTLQEFIELARKANPPLAYASIGNGSQHHLVMEMLKARAGIDLLHVPFKGGGPATTALLGGEIVAMFGGNSVAGHVRAGKLRALAVAGKERSQVFPNLPRLSDVYPGLEVTPWLALFAPAGVPESVLARLRAEIKKLLADPDTVERISRLGGLQPYVTTPAEFDQLLRTEYAKYAEVVKAAGAKID